MIQCPAPSTLRGFLGRRGGQRTQPGLLVHLRSINVSSRPAPSRCSQQATE
ncbi:hypothetical protein CPAR01_15435 [Colletotrichum paranaense]|uniref:Uncharacterized protein n=2 Tax=Colletotrichum acutatum species complex TaxID=2707335 RepID=A0AAI9TTU2_9PEZI|nr:uncharacterized protein CPAR01_15435 [Colletotrichum paranaense]KAI3542961.1 hypothetical protein CSPX01_06557 [Colletotrichum filicis]KAK1445343.1 hypothetical protein CCUS01_12670 [Colletotrichum cuscutae]KAK1519942.1 hypothetical protein CPAR01_15435 [Colletotrichum paranaense]